MEIKKYNLIHNEVNVNPLTLSINFSAYLSEKLTKLIGMNKPIGGVFLFRNFSMWYFNDQEVWQQGAELIYKKISTNRNFILNILKKSEIFKKETLTGLKKYDKEKIFQTPNKKLAHTLKKLSKQGFDLSIYSVLGPVADHHHNHFSNKLEKIINKTRQGKKINLSTPEILNLINTPSQDYPSDKAKSDLYKIKLKINSKNSNLLIEDYLKKWGWLNHGHLGPTATVGDVKKDLKTIKKPVNKKIYKQKQQELYKKLDLNKAEINICQAASVFVYLKGMRAEVCNGIFYFIHNVVEKISSETKIKKEYLLYCSIKEVIKYLSDNKLPIKEELLKRKKYSVWTSKNPLDVKILTGSKAKLFIKNHTKKETLIVNNNTKIEGRVAYPGKVKGLVKVINTVFDIKKMNQGNVLISVQTTPELISAMKKAAAFVTDIGGITSHAAIVAREMKIPCIIGTKFASKILQDGDRVEVDAEQGIVRKV